MKRRQFIQEISALAVPLLLVYTIFTVINQVSIQCGLYTPLFAATSTGLLLGDLQTGLIISAALQLMTPGVVTYGGATAPDYLSGAIMGTTYAIISGQGAEYGIGLAIPIGLLLTQMDILERINNSFFQHYADRYAEKGDWRGVEKANLLGLIPWELSRLVPIALGLIFGRAVVEGINTIIPAQFMTRLKTTSATLLAMDVAILMRYLPIEKYWPYFAIGFVLIASGGGSYTVMAAALVGLALAGLRLIKTEDRVAATADGVSYVGDEGVEVDG